MLPYRGQVPEQLSEAVAAEVRRLLAERGLTGRELARRTNIPQPTIATKLSGKSALDLDDLDAICRVLEVSVSDLLTWAQR